MIGRGNQRVREGILKYGWKEGDKGAKGKTKGRKEARDEYMTQRRF
jgi:hypothetical protein